MKDLWNNLKDTDRPIVLYGMGDGADKVIDKLASIGKTPAAVFASDEFVRGQNFRGYTVINYDRAKQLYPDMIVLVCFGTQLTPVLDNIKRIASECTLFAPDVAVYGGGTFDDDFYQKSKDKIEFISSRLADDTSRHVFDSIIKYKLSGDIRFLTDCETSVDESYQNILNLHDNEIYVDLGAYRGDTVCEFLNHVNGCGKIYAVEPDKKNFSKLYEAYGDSIECINAAATDCVKQVPFTNKKGRNSHVSDGGDFIAGVSVDSIVDEKGASFIKFDVEGNEASAIEGAKDTILRFRPKMCIAAYHRFDDLLAIPLRVLEIRPDYKMYIRHFPYIPAWDTNFYFV